jgi:hypothetical protein
MPVRATRSARTLADLASSPVEQLEPRALLAAAPTDLALRFSGASIPVQIVPGDRFNQEVALINRSAEAAANGQVRLVFKLSRDRVISDDAITLLDQTVTVSVDPDSTLFLNPDVTVPSDTPRGRYFVVASFAPVDPDVLNDPNPDNNTRSLSSSRELVWQFGRVGDRTGIVLTLPGQAAGAPPAIFSIDNGPGTGFVGLVEGRYVVRVFDTNRQSQVSIDRDDSVTALVPAARIGVHRVILNSALGSVFIQDADILRGITSRVGLGTLNFTSGTFADGAEILLRGSGGGAGNTSVVLRAEYANLRIDSNRTLRRVDVGVETGVRGVAQAGTLSLVAPGLISFVSPSSVTTGEFRLTGRGGNLATLGNVDIAGSLTASTPWRVNGKADRIAFGGTSAFLAEFKGQVGLFTVNGPASGILLAARAIATLDFSSGVSDSIFSAGGGIARTGDTFRLTLGRNGSIGVVNVTGNVVGTSFLAGARFNGGSGETYRAVNGPGRINSQFGLIRVTGTVDDATRFVAGVFTSTAQFGGAAVDIQADPRFIEGVS